MVLLTTCSLYRNYPHRPRIMPSFRYLRLSRTSKSSKFEAIWGFGAHLILLGCVDDHAPRIPTSCRALPDQAPHGMSGSTPGRSQNYQEPLSKSGHSFRHINELPMSISSESIAYASKTSGCMKVSTLCYFFVGCMLGHNHGNQGL